MRVDWMRCFDRVRTECLDTGSGVWCWMIPVESIDTPSVSSLRILYQL